MKERKSLAEILGLEPQPETSEWEHAVNVTISDMAEDMRHEIDEELLETVLSAARRDLPLGWLNLAKLQHEEICDLVNNLTVDDTIVIRDLRTQEIVELKVNKIDPDEHIYFTTTDSNTDQLTWKAGSGYNENIRHLRNKSTGHAVFGKDELASLLYHDLYYIG